MSLSDNQIKVAVLDTGYYLNSNTLKLCPSGHKDFTGTGLEDIIGHGQNVSHIISDQLSNNKACLIIIKWTNNTQGFDDYTLESLRYAKTIKDLKVLNFSGGGYGKRNEECKLVKELQDNGVRVVMAAGNNNHDLSDNCNYFPACCNNNVIVVGNLNEDGSRQEISNYGTPVKYWEKGVKVRAGGVVQTGTSQAAAIRSGKEILTILTKDGKIK